MTESIVWAVVWAVLAFVLPVFIIALSGALGTFIGTLFAGNNRDSEAHVVGGGIGIIVGWALSAAWLIFAVIQAVLNVISAVQAATGA